jgi:thymidylate synthase (FAD)
MSKIFFVNGGYINFKERFGSDYEIANSARMSRNNYGSATTSNQDEELISNLARWNHWTPFALQSIRIELRMPIFVARQWMKHSVGVVTLEKSMRYTKKPLTIDDFYIPKDLDKDVILSYRNSLISSIDCYNHFIKDGIPAEDARDILPNSLFTKMTQTMTLQAAINLCRLRMTKHAQREIREYATKLYEILKEQFPLAWKYCLYISEQQ